MLYCCGRYKSPGEVRSDRGAYKEETRKIILSLDKIRKVGGRSMPDERGRNVSEGGERSMSEESSEGEKILGNKCEGKQTGSQWK
jgi:hypothetical protein